MIIGFILLSPFFLIKYIFKFIIWLFTGKKKKLLKELETPKIIPFEGVEDDRQRPPVKPGELSKEEFTAMWKKWRQSQKAIIMINDYKKRDEALSYIEEAERSFPNSKYIKYGRVLALHYQRKNVEAYNLLKHLPEIRVFNSLKVDLAIAAKDYNVACQAISNLPLSNQLFTDMIFKHANCLIELREWKAALEVLTNFEYRKKANKGQPTSMWHYLKGNCYEGLGQIRQAVEEYEKTLAYPLNGFNATEKLNTLRQASRN